MILSLMDGQKVGNARPSAEDKRFQGQALRPEKLLGKILRRNHDERDKSVVASWAFSSAFVYGERALYTAYGVGFGPFCDPRALVYL
jgi:hypothetical protein